MPQPFWIDYAFALTVVAAVLAGLFALARVVSRRRAFPRGDNRFVTILESTMLSQQTAVHVVKAGGRYLLVGASPAGLRTLADLAPDDVDNFIATARCSRTSASRTTSRA